jgi:putative methyltransferase (TIGR04325 family)
MRLYRIWRRRLLPPHAGQLFDRVAHYLPPVVVNALRYLLSEWEYMPGGWQPDSAPGQGWNDCSVATAQEHHWPTLVENLQGPGPLGVSHFLRSKTREDRADHNAMMSYGYVLARASRNKDGVSVLDWGGSVGHYYLYSRALLPEVAIDYHCYDVPRLCDLGRKLLPEAHFCDDSAEVLRRRYDLVISSSSLHYFEDWREVARKLAAATGDFLYIARLQTVVRGESFVVVQRPYHSGYHTEYLSWFLSRLELVSCLEEAGLELVREFVYAEDWLVRGAPEKGDCRGFLFQRPSP